MERPENCRDLGITLPHPEKFMLIMLVGFGVLARESK
jgi:hypothetical protein